MADNKQPVIIKYVKKAAHGHHGGAWKVAYADFVTAMMAFFLLLWLLNAVTEQQLKGISDYFAPISISSSVGGPGSRNAGSDMTSPDGAMAARASMGEIVAPPPTIGEDEGIDVSTQPPKDKTLVGKADGTEGVDKGKGEKTAPATETPLKVVTQTQTPPRDITEAQLQEAMIRQEEESFAKAKDVLERAMASIPEMKQYRGSLLVDNTEEGLRIQIVDQDGLSMFPSGQSSMYGHTRALLELVARVVNQMPAKQRISISGYTDATPFADSRYTNWELSLERALASRRVLKMAGVPDSRIDRVVGRADQDPLDPNNRFAPQNRRISIVLMRESRAPQE